MAMPKKGSRLITVDGTVFRWRVSHRPTYSQDKKWFAATRSLYRIPDGTWPEPWEG